MKAVTRARCCARTRSAGFDSLPPYRRCASVANLEPELSHGERVRSRPAVQPADLRRAARQCAVAAVQAPHGRADDEVRTERSGEARLARRRREGAGRAWRAPLF